MSSLTPTILFKRACESTDGYVCYHIPIPAVIGIVFGVAFLLITGGFITFICVKKRRHARKRQAGIEVDDAIGYRGTKAPERIEFNPNAY